MGTVSRLLSMPLPRDSLLETSISCSPSEHRFPWDSPPGYPWDNSSQIKISFSCPCLLTCSNSIIPTPWSRGKFGDPGCLPTHHPSQLPSAPSTGLAGHRGFLATVPPACEARRHPSPLPRPQAPAGQEQGRDLWVGAATRVAQCWRCWVMGYHLYIQQTPSRCTGVQHCLRTCAASPEASGR